MTVATNIFMKQFEVMHSAAENIQLSYQQFVYVVLRAKKREGECVCIWNRESSNKSLEQRGEELGIYKKMLL